jgi:HAD superfamily hydrolase (TIGR01509 family)
LDRGADFDTTVAAVRARFPEWAHECDAFRERWPETLGEFIDESVATAEQLMASGVACYVLSNSSAQTLPRSAETSALLARFHGVMLSAEVGVLKPDPRIYSLAVERFGLVPGETVFVDDNAANVEAAIACGWQGHHFQRGGVRPSWWAK